jgi:hypothetical protein
LIQVQHIGTLKPKLKLLDIDKQLHPSNRRKRAAFGEIINEDRWKRRRGAVTALSTQHADKEVESEPIPIEGFP